jgi:hypothetical protein
LLGLLSKQVYIPALLATPCKTGFEKSLASKHTEETTHLMQALQVGII